MNRQSKIISVYSRKDKNDTPKSSNIWLAFQPYTVTQTRGLVCSETKDTNRIAVEKRFSCLRLCLSRFTPNMDRNNSHFKYPQLPIDCHATLQLPTLVYALSHRNGYKWFF